MKGAVRHSGTVECSRVTGDFPRGAVLLAACLLVGGGCSTPGNGDPADGAVAPDRPAAPDAAPDAAPPDGAPADGFSPAPHQAFPQVPDQGGPRLRHPAVVTVTFADDPRRATLEAFARWIVGSRWLAAVGAEYGVGAGSTAGAAQRTEHALVAVRSADIEAFLAQGVLDGSLPRPAGGLTDALYMVYYPSTTAITATFVDGITLQSCTDFGAYHGEVHQSGMDFSYAAMADCGVAGSGLTDLEEIEQAASHELIEAATDAMPITAPAFQLRRDGASAWFSTFRFEVEVGDLCEVPAQAYREGGFVAQRTWSNTGAASGSDPCVPADPAVAYYNTTATPDLVQRVAPGTTVEYTLHGWSTGALPNWRLSTRVRGTLAVTTVFSSNVMNNGGTATLRVTVPPGAVSGSASAIYLVSQRSSQDYHTWPLYIAVP